MFSYFREHPEIAAPHTKEIHFFDNESACWAEPDYRVLQSFFKDSSEAGVKIDATPIYSFWTPSLSRIREYNPEARLIMIFRDPFERALSHWRMQFSRGIEHLTFAEAIRSGRRRLSGAPMLSQNWRIFSYIERGFYSAQVERALHLFPRDQVLCLRAEDLRLQHEATLSRISSFLRIGPFKPTSPKREFASSNHPYPSKPTIADLELVSNILRYDAMLLSQLTGLQINGWPVICGSLGDPTNP